MTITPSGCRWCGLDRRGHAQRWSSKTRDDGSTVGWHQHEPPTQEQILRRMRDRRAVR